MRASTFGFVFQDASLDPSRTVLDNLLETALYRGVRREELIPLAHELVDRFEVSVPLGRRPGQISGGQAQRIGLCRALIGKPTVVLADEPTGNLDRRSGDAVVRGLRTFAEEGGCVVMVTHDDSVASQADVRLEQSGPS